MDGGEWGKLYRRRHPMLTGMPDARPRFVMSRSPSKNARPVGEPEVLVDCGHFQDSRNRQVLGPSQVLRGSSVRQLLHWLDLQSPCRRPRLRNPLIEPLVRLCFVLLKLWNIQVAWQFSGQSARCAQPSFQHKSGRYSGLILEIALRLSWMVPCDRQERLDVLGVALADFSLIEVPVAKRRTVVCPLKSGPP
mgnify:CR=1 FL=1